MLWKQTRSRIRELNWKGIVKMRSLESELGVEVQKRPTQALSRELESKKLEGWSQSPESESNVNSDPVSSLIGRLLFDI